MRNLTGVGSVYRRKSLNFLKDIGFATILAMSLGWVNFFLINFIWLDLKLVKDGMIVIQEDEAALNTGHQINFLN